MLSISSFLTDWAAFLYCLLRTCNWSSTLYWVLFLHNPRIWTAGYAVHGLTAAAAAIELNASSAWKARWSRAYSRTEKSWVRPRLASQIQQPWDRAALERFLVQKIDCFNVQLYEQVRSRKPDRPTMCSCLTMD